MYAGFYVALYLPGRYPVIILWENFRERPISLLTIYLQKLLFVLGQRAIPRSLNVL
jgi:hypothetical protein